MLRPPVEVTVGVLGGVEDADADRALLDGALTVEGAPPLKGALMPADADVGAGVDAGAPGELDPVQAVNVNAAITAPTTAMQRDFSGDKLSPNGGSNTIHGVA